MADEKKIVDDVEELKKKLSAAEKKAKAAEKKLAEVEEKEKAFENAVTNATADAVTHEKSIKKILDAQEKVTIRLFKDDDKYKEDLFVGINGMTYQIKRGVDVEVPKAVAEVIKLSQSQDANAITRMESFASKNGDLALM